MLLSLNEFKNNGFLFKCVNIDEHIASIPLSFSPAVRPPKDVPKAELPVISKLISHYNTMNVDLFIPTSSALRSEKR